MHEIVKLYDLLVNHNEIAHQTNHLSVEIFTHPLVIQIWFICENEYIEHSSFQSASKWIESRILGQANG